MAWLASTNSPPPPFFSFEEFLGPSELQNHLIILILVFCVEVRVSVIENENESLIWA